MTLTLLTEKSIKVTIFHSKITDNRVMRNRNMSVPIPEEIEGNFGGDRKFNLWRGLVKNDDYFLTKDKSKSRSFVKRDPMNVVITQTTADSERKVAAREASQVRKHVEKISETIDNAKSKFAKYFKYDFDEFPETDHNDCRQTILKNTFGQPIVISGGLKTRKFVKTSLNPGMKLKALDANRGF